MRETHAVIYDIKKYAIHDGPGIRTTVFFKGCPLSCQWCHNPEGMITGQQILYSPERCVGCRECLEVCPQGAKVIIRIPLIPGVNDSEEAIACTGSFIAGLSGNPPVELLPYHDFHISKYDRLGMAYGGRNISVPPSEAVNRTAGQLEALGLKVKVH